MVPNARRVRSLGYSVRNVELAMVFEVGVTISEIS